MPYQQLFLPSWLSPPATTHHYTTHMPPKMTAKSWKCTALNIDEVTTTKKPWKTKQPDPSNNDKPIKEDPEKKTQGKATWGGGKGAGLAKCRGKAAWYIPLATPSHHELTLRLFNRVTSMQKATTVARLKKSKGSDPELKEYISPFPLLFWQELTFARAEEKVMKSGVGIALPECFCSTTVVTSAPIIPLCLTCQHQSDITQKSAPSKPTDQGHTGCDTNSEQDNEQEDKKNSPWSGTTTTSLFPMHQEQRKERLRWRTASIRVELHITTHSIHTLTKPQKLPPGAHPKRITQPPTQPTHN